MLSRAVEGVDVGARSEAKVRQAVFRSRLRLVIYASSLCFAISIPGAGAEAPVRRKCAPTPDRFLTDKLTVWQQRLKLDDWKISIMMVHPGDLKPNTLGNISWYESEKFAVIRVLDASDYQVGCRDMLDDMEFTVVHELIHLQLLSLPRSEASRKDEEVAVNHITNALLLLERHK